ncbi:MAG: hypothetical protein NTY08_00580 [Proteobacteria bacterium]|nr:hypothetical protein [Pseudomonadota bacterium]
MGELGTTQSMNDRRLEKFVNQVRDICRSPKSFKSRMDVDVGHIAWRAQAAGQDIRNAIDQEKMASLIINGTLRSQNCRTTPPIEAVFDGRFADLVETLFNPIRELKHQNIGVRIVVREGSAKHLVVTIHPLGSSPADLMSLPEVPHDIW